MISLFKKFGLVGAFISILLVSTTANAIIIKDTVVQEVYLKKNSVNTYTYTYTHNLLDDGFELGTALNGDLAINFWDDDSDKGKGKEKIRIKIKKGGKADKITEATTYLKKLTIKTLARINDLGKLKITIKALKGDFYVGDSILSVYTNNGSNNVPAPGILGMLGLGLLGIGVAGRMRKT